MTERLHKMVNGERIEMSESEEAEIRAEWTVNAELQKAADYEFMRKSAYPSPQEQLDMIYEDKTNGTTKWADLIASIETKYPKP